MKRFTLVLALMFGLVASGALAAANPFSDVPFSHWAYDAVQKLASKGILQGYPDGTFKGEKAVTRYALAMVTAKMLATVEQMMEKGFGEHLVTKSDLQTLEKLTVEFADELALLGVKVTALEDDMQVVKEDVSMLKKDVEGIKDYMAKGGMEKVKLSGDMLVRHSSLITNRDHSNTGLGTNVDNAQTQTQLRFKFTANIDENIQAVARWRMFSKTDQRANAIGVTDAQRWGYAGAGTLHRGYDLYNAEANVEADLAYLHIKHMFRFGGDFTFGRNFYTEGHGLLLSDYVDAIKFYKRSGDVDVTFYTIYDCHRGSYKDDVPGVNFKNIWALALDYKWRDHDLYLNIYGQDDSASLRRNYADPTGGLAANDSLFNAAGILAAANLRQYEEDARWDVEFGSKGPIGKNGHWDYDLGFAYTNYEINMVTGATASIANAAAADTLNNNWSNVNLDGWLGHVAVKWDSKKEWAAKLAYSFANDEAVGAYAIDNDRRYDNGFETPYEDVARGNNYFRAGLLNMYDLKLQVEYRPRDTRHYFRLAGDFLDEMSDTVSNDAARVAAGRHFPGIGDVDDTAATNNKTNSIYDRWNNFGTSDANATVLTFEYRYQLAENTRIRIGYTAFEMTGDYRNAGYASNAAGTAAAYNAAIAAQSAGRNANAAGDYDYNYFWAELYSQF